MKNVNCRRRRRVVTAALAFAPIIGTGPVRANTWFYNGTNGGTWTQSSAIWSATYGGASSGFPVAGDIVNINKSGGSFTVNFGVTTSVNFGPVTIDGTSSFTNTLNVASNTLNANGQLTVGFGSAGAAIMNQTSGTVNVINTNALDIGLNTGSNGTYLLGVVGGGSGTLNVNANETIGWSGTATFNQYSGTHYMNNSAASMYMAFNGSNSVGTYSIYSGGFTMAGGDPNGISQYVGYAGTGTFNVYGGGVLLSKGLVLGNNSGAIGTYFMSNSSSQVTVSGSEIIGMFATGSGGTAGGTFNNAAGVNFLNTSSPLIIGYNSNATGLYLLGSANAWIQTQSNETVGLSGTGTINQSNGLNAMAGTTLYVGFNNGSTGTYILGAGNLGADGGEYIGQNGKGTFIQTGGTNTIGQLSPHQNLYIGYNTSSVGTYVMNGSSASLLVLYNEYVNYSSNVTNQPAGTFNQSAGSHTVEGTLEVGNPNFGASSALYLLSGTGSLTNYGSFELGGGTFNQSGGTFLSTGGSAGEYIGYAGPGTYIQGGGTNNASAGLVVGWSATATYVMNNAVGTSVLLANGEDIGPHSGAAVFNQSAGTNTVTNGFGIEEQGTYLFSGGILTALTGNATAPAESIDGLFIQTGGSHTVGSVNSSNQNLYIGIGTYSMDASAGSSTLTVFGNEYLGSHAVNFYGGLGTFNQSAGTHSITGSLVIGDLGGDTGTYNLTGTASLAVGTNATALTAGEYLGNNGIGTVIQTGGSDTIGTVPANQNLYLGYNTSSTGIYVMSGSTASLTVNGNAYIGGNSIGPVGVGVWNISGGTASITGTLKIWNSSGSVVNLTGGVLNLATLSNAGSASAFQWTGGTLNFTTAATIDSNFALGSTVTLNPGMLLSSSVSLTNNQQITLAGGAVGGAGLITNNALLTGFGTVNGSGGFLNNSELLQANGNLVLANTGTNTNAGNVDMAPGRSLILQSVTLTNTGTINTNGGTISGGTLVNTGTVAGRGSISSAFNNGTGSTLVAQGGTLSMPAFNNSGSVQVTPGATLSGGAITNTGRVQGAGTISNAITNTGTIESVGGILTLNGTLTNPTPGTIYADPGSDTLANAFATNASTLELDGGVFETLGHTLSNTGLITGYGRLRTGGLTNNNQVLIAGGSTTVDGTVNNSNGATVTVQNASALFNNLVTNNGTFRVIAGGSATFAGNYSGGNVSNLAMVNSGTFALSSALISSGNFTNSGTSNISGGQTWAPGTTFTNTAGTATFSTDAGSSNASNLSVFVTGGNVAFASTQHLTALNVSSGGIAQVTGGGNGNRSMVYTPSIAVTGMLDLTANDLDIQAGNLLNVRALVTQGFNNGTWAGGGITSSSAANDTTHRTALGEIVAPATTTLDGLPVNANDVLVKLTYYGDADLSGKVDGTDYSRIDNGFLTGASGWFNGDFNYDGTVNGSDYTLIDNAFNSQGVRLDSQIADPTASIASQIGRTSEVPEPAELGLMAIAAAGLLGRRRVVRS